MLLISQIALQDIIDELKLRSKKYLRGEGGNLKVLSFELIEIETSLTGR